MSLLPTAMRDPDMQPLGLPLRLMAPPQPDQRAENMAKWFENGQFEIDAETGKHVDAGDPFRMAGLHDGLDEMLERAWLAGGRFTFGVDLGRGEDKSSVQIWGYEANRDAHRKTIFKERFAPAERAEVARGRGCAAPGSQVVIGPDLSVVTHEVEDFHAAMRRMVDEVCGVPSGTVQGEALRHGAPTSDSEVRDFYKRSALGKIVDDERAAFDRRLALRSNRPR